jgi:hypothetical protein
MARFWKIPVLVLATAHFVIDVLFQYATRPYHGLDWQMHVLSPQFVPKRKLINAYCHYRNLNASTQKHRGGSQSACNLTPRLCISWTV